MIYVSIDNDHHSGLILTLIKKYKVPFEKITFISQISNRNTTLSNSKYNCRTIKGHPLSSGSGYKNIITYVRSIFHQAFLHEIFNFKKDDILILVTEYQLNNALLARKMKNAGGQVYLFDEGIGFYFNNSLYCNLNISLTDKIFLKIYDIAFSVLNIPAYAKKGFEGRMCISIKDKFIDRIYSRMRLQINRPSKIYGYRNFLASKKSLGSKRKNTAIFFANNLSAFNIKDKDVELSISAIKQMTSSFKKVYIKIHPSDFVVKNDIYYHYKKLSNFYKNIYLIDNSLTGNEAIEAIRPNIVVGSIGAVMFDAFFFNCQPIFLFQFLPLVREFNICKLTLKSIKYKYIKNLNEITPDYRSNVDISKLLYKTENFSWLENLNKKAVA